MEGGFGQVGCVCIAQGFEYDRNGVIIGPDLLWRTGRLITVPSASKDPALRKKGITDEQADRLIAIPTRSCSPEACLARCSTPWMKRPRSSSPTSSIDVRR